MDDSQFYQIEIFYRAIGYCLHSVSICSPVHIYTNYKLGIRPISSHTAQYHVAIGASATRKRASCLFQRHQLSPPQVDLHILHGASAPGSYRATTRIIGTIYMALSAWGSQTSSDVIQALNESLCFDRRPMGEDRTRLPRQSDGSNRSVTDNRLFIEAVLWIVCTSSPRRDPPAQFGNWSTALRLFSDCRKADLYVKILQACSDEPDMEYTMG
ncbi:transposase [Labrys neptuniae]